MRKLPKNTLSTLALVLLLLLLSKDLQSQWWKKILVPGKCDSNYIQTFPDDLTGRFISSGKNNQFRVFDNNLPGGLIYKPNNRVITGLGVHYGLIGFNIGFPLPWSVENQDDEIYGKTDYLDLQAHFYFRSFTIDLYYLNYKGFYLENSMEMLPGWQDPETYQIRGDLRLVSYGGTFHYFFNKKKFSYKAIFNQNEWQKKSAGSFILGGGIYFAPIKADSSLIPDDISYNPFFGNVHFNRAELFSAGPMAGYTHTFVMWKRFFINLSVAGGITAGYTNLEDKAHNFSERTGITWHFQYTLRAGLGYNSHRWYVGFHYVNTALRNQTSIDQGWLQFDAGIFQFTLARRFHLKKPIKILRPELW